MLLVGVGWNTMGAAAHWVVSTGGRVLTVRVSSHHRLWRAMWGPTVTLRRGIELLLGPSIVIPTTTATAVLVGVATVIVIVPTTTTTVAGGEGHIGAASSRVRVRMRRVRRMRRMSVIVVVVVVKLRVLIFVSVVLVICSSGRVVPSSSVIGIGITALRVSRVRVGVRSWWVLLRLRRNHLRIFWYSTHSGLLLLLMASLLLVHCLRGRRY